MTKSNGIITQIFREGTLSDLPIIDAIKLQ